VPCWCAFTGDEHADGLTGDANNKVPTPSLGVIGKLPMPESGDNYANAPLMLPRGNLLACGMVIWKKHNARGDPFGNADSNPILDSCMYCVEFDNGNVCELTGNVIAESMYTSCNADGNEYILFDSILVDYRSNQKAVTTDNQQLSTTIATHSANPLLDGICAFSGKMDPPPGNPSRI